MKRTGFQRKKYSWKRKEKPLGFSKRRTPTLYADKMWRTDVKERDDYVCQKCGVRSKQNHAHHIAPRSRRPDLKFDRQNGITLCADCHSWVHEHPREATALGLLSNVAYEKAMKERAA
jgi:5-methylcytosine-specific restriction endonuclease McrA